MGLHGVRTTKRRRDDTLLTARTLASGWSPRVLVPPPTELIRIPIRMRSTRKVLDLASWVGPSIAPTVEKLLIEATTRLRMLQFAIEEGSLSLQQRLTAIVREHLQIDTVLSSRASISSPTISDIPAETSVLVFFEPQAPEGCTSRLCVEHVGEHGEFVIHFRREEDLLQ